MRQTTSAMGRLRLGVLASLGLMLDPVLAMEPKYGPKNTVRMEALAEDERRCKKYETRKLWYGATKHMQTRQVCVDEVEVEAGAAFKAGPRHTVERAN